MILGTSVRLPDDSYITLDTMRGRVQLSIIAKSFPAAAELVTVLRETADKLEHEVTHD
jgi:hypothetical protein